MSGYTSGELSGVQATAAPRRRPITRPRTPSLQLGHVLILTSLTLIILIRFFSEGLHAIPRAANFIDVPLAIVVAAVAASRRSEAPRPVHQSLIFGAGVAFLAVTTLSTLSNFNRVDIFPALAFVYDFLGPLVFYVSTYILWEPGRARAVSRLLVAMALLQFITIVFHDLPTFLKERNPDSVSGTFGTNAYQLVFFLLLFIALVTGIVTFEPRSIIRFAAIPFIGAAYLAIFLAQYRTLLITTALATVFIGALVIRRARGFFIAAAAVAGLIVGMWFIVVYVPTNKFTQAFDALRTNPSYFIDSRLGPTRDVYHLYGDDWHFPLIGTGPGTYSSRAWATFADSDSTSAANVAGPYARRLMGGALYHTDVSDKYVIPRMKAPPQYGTHQFSNPFSSYLALLAEVGPVAFLLLVGIYATGLVRSVRAVRYLADTAAPGDPLPAVALATATAFFVLMQMALFDNWLEVARVTVPTWILFGIVAREMGGRREASEFPN